MAEQPGLLEWLFGKAGPEPLPPHGPQDELIRDENLQQWLARMNDAKGRSDPGIFAGLRQPGQTGDPVEGLPAPDIWHRPRSDMPSMQLFNQFYNQPQEGRITDVGYRPAAPSGGGLGGLLPALLGLVSQWRR